VVDAPSLIVRVVLSSVVDVEKPRHPGEMFAIIIVHSHNAAKGKLVVDDDDAASTRGESRRSSFASEDDSIFLLSGVSHRPSNAVWQRSGFGNDQPSRDKYKNDCD
jgi:hypothetical protein